MQVGRRHHKRRRSSRLPPVPDINGDVAPDLETVIHDEIRRRRLHGLSLDENDEPVAAMRVPIPLHATGVGRHLVPRLIEKNKSCSRARRIWMIDTVHEDELEPYVLAVNASLASRGVLDAPRPASDVEGFRMDDALLVGKLLGARVALDVEKVAPGMATALDDGRRGIGRRRRHGRAGGVEIHRISCGLLDGERISWSSRSRALLGDQRRRRRCLFDS